MRALYKCCRCNQADTTRIKRQSVFNLRVSQETQPACFIELRTNSLVENEALTKTRSCSDILWSFGKKQTDRRTDGERDRRRDRQEAGFGDGPTGGELSDTGRKLLINLSSDGERNPERAESDSGVCVCVCRQACIVVFLVFYISYIHQIWLLCSANQAKVSWKKRRTEQERKWRKQGGPQSRNEQVWEKTGEKLMWRKRKTGVGKGFKGARYRREDEERDRKYGVYALKSLLFISAHIQPPSNTYFDTRQLKKNIYLRSLTLPPTVDLDGKQEEWQADPNYANISGANSSDVHPVCSKPIIQFQQPAPGHSGCWSRCPSCQRRLDSHSTIPLLNFRSQWFYSWTSIYRMLVRQIQSRRC